MVRSVRITAVVLGLAWTGFAAAQSPSVPVTAPPPERFITVREEGKPPQRCKLLKKWHEPNGVPAFQVQAVDTGEVMTIVGSGPPAGGASRAMSTRIFHWSSSNTPPEGAPKPPPTTSAMTSPPAQPVPSRVMSVSPPQTVAPAPSLSGTMSPQFSHQGSGQMPPAAARLMPPSANAVTVAPPQPMSSGTTPSLAPQTVSPAPPLSAPIPFAPTTQPTPATLTARKPENASLPLLSSPTPTQPVLTPPAVTTGTPTPLTNAAPPSAVAGSNPSPMTPMSTPVIQQPLVQTPAIPDGTPNTPPQPRLVPSASGNVLSQTPNSCSCPAPCNTCCQPCLPCGQPCPPCDQASCVCCTPSPMRQSFISRLFKPRCPCECTEVVCQPEPAAAPAPAPAPAPAAATPPAPSVAKVVSEPAKPRDWRESWGKVEPWKATAQAASDKPVEIVTQRAAPKPVPMEMPTQPNPIEAPDMYRDMAMSARIANSKIPEETQPAPASPPKSRLFALKRPSEPKLPVPPPHQAEEAPASAEATPNVASPLRSPGRVVQLPANESNAFWSPPTPPPSNEPKPKFNAFNRDEDRPPQPGVPPRIAPGYSGPLPPPGPMPLVRQQPLPTMPSRPDMGVPDALGNAFTLPGTRRPIPADFGGTPQEPNGFDPAVRMGQGSPPQAYSMGMPAMPRSPMPNMIAMGPRPPMAMNPLSVPAAPVAPGSAAAAVHPGGVPQLLTTLKDSLYPSQREAAAEQLSELNGRIQPLVVESLMKSAREDPAATVRAACVHALTHMKANPSEVTALARDLKSDRDPRVRQEAEEALNALGDSGIQQASHR